MSFSLNEVRLIGHLGKDPEIRRTQDGRPIANFSIATSRQWKDKTTGERKEHTEWHRIVVFSEGLAKVVEQYLKKGMQVYVSGELQTRKWTDQAGADRYVTEIICQGFKTELGMLGKGNGGGVPANDGSDHDFSREPSRTSDSGRGGGIAPRNSGNISSGRPGNEMDDDIPF
jgi:single-strand DNA-binding protein